MLFNCVINVASLIIIVTLSRFYKSNCERFWERTLGPQRTVRIIFEYIIIALPKYLIFNVNIIQFYISYYSHITHFRFFVIFYL